MFIEKTEKIEKPACIHWELFFHGCLVNSNFILPLRPLCKKGVFIEKIEKRKASMYPWDLIRL